MRRSPSITDELGAHFTCGFAMRAMCLFWLVPAVWLVWTGFEPLGLRAADRADTVTALHRIQAIVVLLAIFGSLVGAIWAIRTWYRVPRLPQLNALVAVAVWQMTVGWLHLYRPAGPLLAVTVVEGIAIAWAAIAAARAIAPAPEWAPAPTPAVELVADGEAEADVDLVSQAPVRPSLPGPAVGR